MNTLRLRAACTVLVFVLAGCTVSETERYLFLISVDTLRADHLGAYGSRDGLTPNLDRFAAKSQLFRHAFAPASFTLPSVCAMLTGRYPEQVGVVENTLMLGSEVPTLALRLKEFGWRTGAVVSNFVLRPASGLDQGFEVYDAKFSQLEANRDLPERLAAPTTDAALDTLDRLRGQGRQPVFLWVHYQDPHGPYVPPEGLRERFLEAEREAPDGRRRLPVSARNDVGRGEIPHYQAPDGRRDVAYYRAGYKGEIRYLDQEVGRLLNGIAERGLLERSLIVFTADHGEGMGEDDYWFAHGLLISDPLVRVPLMIRGPGLAPAVREDAASLVDLYPTLLEHSAIRLEPGLPGRDLLAAGAASEPYTVFLANLLDLNGKIFGVIHGDYAYRVKPQPDGTLEEELRDLRSGALRELEGPTLRNMRRKLMAHRQQLIHAGTAVQQRLSDQDAEKLRALGYLNDG